MRVRCWVMVGSPVASLPTEKHGGSHTGALPEAATFSVGDWVYWKPSPADGWEIVLVCVEIPL